MLGVMQFCTVQPKEGRHTKYEKPVFHGEHNMSGGGGVIAAAPIILKQPKLRTCPI